MLSFLLKRLARAVLTMLLVVAIAFAVLRLSADPAVVILGPDAPPDAVAAFRHAWGLDRPLWMQFGFYITALLHGDFGRSMINGARVLPLVLSRVPTTLSIMLPALLLAGAVVTESVFAWPGLGRLMVTSVGARDLAVVQCILILVALTMVLSNLTVDLVYGLIDPRLRHSERPQR